MQVTLRQSDIEKALKDYITAQGIRTEGKDVQIIFTAGRRGTGITAEIAIEAGAQALGMGDVPPIQEGQTIPNPEPVVAEPANEPEGVPVKSISLFG